MAFGFDASLILPASSTPQTSLSELVNARSQAAQQQLAQAQLGQAQQRLGMEQQQHQATLADLLWKQQRQRSLADLVSQNAGVYGDPMAHAYAQAGFGDEASQAAQAALQRQKEIEAIAQHHLDIKRSQLSAVTTPEQYKATLAGMPPEMRQQWGLPEEYDADAVKRFVNSGIAPKDQAELENKRAETAVKAKEVNKGRYHLVPDPVKGGLTRIDEMTGASSPVSGPASTDGDFNPLKGMKPKDINEEFNKLTDSLSDNNARKLLGQNAQALQRAEALEKLLAVPDLNKITPQQLREAGTALNGLIAKGGPQAVSQIDEMVPESKAAEWANIKQKFLNEPEGANAEGFLRNMLETAAREKALTRDQMKRIREEAIPNYSYLRGANKARFDNILKGVGLNPEDYDANGGKKSAAELAVNHYKSQLQPGERLVMSAKGQAKAIGKDEALPAGFEEVK